GTYLLSATVEKYEAIVLDRVVLIGSIVDCSYDWNARLSTGQLNQVRNELSGQDPIVKIFRYAIARWLMPGAGPSGIDGFNTTVSRLEQQRFAFYSHSSCFVSRLHCLTYWIPFLRQTFSFRDLCRRCVDDDPRLRATALLNFDVLYRGAIIRALRIMRPE